MRLGDGRCDVGERGELYREVVGGVITIVVRSCEASIGGRMKCRVSLYTAFSVNGSKLARVDGIVSRFFSSLFYEDIVVAIGDLCIINEYTIKSTSWWNGNVSFLPLFKEIKSKQIYRIV